MKRANQREINAGQSLAAIALHAAKRSCNDSASKRVAKAIAKLRWRGWINALALVVLVGIEVPAVRAQAPSLAWTANVSGQLFAVDSQTNSYVNVSGTVIQLSPAGVPLQTNAICPLPGIAQRDNTGNFYFAGTFNGTQDFGGITLTGLGNYCAKYTSDGTLDWAVSFNPPSGRNGYPLRSDVWDLRAEPDGGCYVAYDTQVYPTTMYLKFARFDESGQITWDVTGPQLFAFTSLDVTLGEPTSANFLYLMRSLFSVFGGTVYPYNQYLSLSSMSTAQSARPVVDDLGQLLFVQSNPTHEQNQLAKFATNGTPLWVVPTATAEPEVVIARDPQANVYLGSDAGKLSAYDSNGNFLWSTNYFGQIIRQMIVDGSGNRFISLNNGEIARLAGLTPPAITSQPVPKTALVGDAVSFNAGVSGSPLLSYTWLLNGAPVNGGTAATLTLPSVTTTQAGLYSLVVTNFAGAITSAPAMLRVKSVELYSGAQLLAGGTYVFSNTPTFTVRSAFPSGAIYYTLDGSAPNFASLLYTGPFQVPVSATVRALGYSADFLQSEEADPVNAIVLVNHTLSTSTGGGGGNVTLSPPGGTYIGSNTVTATAAPWPGWTFLYWQGDAAGTSPTANLTMERDKAVRAVFGTTLSTTVAGSGQVQLYPASGPYAYGSVVRLTGVPQAGNYFGAWGNAASGNTNPLYFTITSPTQTVSSIFGATAAGQVALTLEISGHGQVQANPRANAYPLNQAVTLTAVPEAGQSFAGWSGDASGTQNPLTISMTQAKVISANFSARPVLRVSQAGIEGWSESGMRFTVLGDPQTILQIYGSTNLTAWESLGLVTNSSGTVQFTDPNVVTRSRRFYRTAPWP